MRTAGGTWAWVHARQSREGARGHGDTGTWGDPARARAGARAWAGKSWLTRWQGDTETREGAEGFAT